MNISDNPFAVLADPSSTKNTNKNLKNKNNQNNKNTNQNNRNNNNQRNQKNQQQKKPQNQNQNQQKNQQNKPKGNPKAGQQQQAPKPALNPKAAKIFQQANAVSEEEKKKRNQERKLRKQQKKLLEKKKGAASAAAKGGATGENAENKAEAAAPAAPVLSKEELANLEKQLAAERREKVDSYLKEVGKVLNGRSVLIEMDLEKLPASKETEKILQTCGQSPFQGLSLLLKSRPFYELFVRSLPRELEKERIPAIKRRIYFLRRLRTSDFINHLIALLAVPTPKKTHKSTEDAYSLVEGFLEGVFNVTLKPKKEQKERVEDEEDDIDAEYSYHSVQTLSQYFPNIEFPESKKEEKADPSKEKKEEAGESANKDQNAGKTPNKKQQQQSSKKDPNEIDLTDYTTRIKDPAMREELKQKSITMIRRIPRRWKIVMIALPIFGSDEDEKGGSRGQGRGKRDTYSNNKQEKGRKKPVKSVTDYKPGFLFEAQGYDNLFLMWDQKSFNIKLLFTTGKNVSASSNTNTNANANANKNTSNVKQQTQQQKDGDVKDEQGKKEEEIKDEAKVNEKNNQQQGKGGNQQQNNNNNNKQANQQQQNANKGNQQQNNNQQAKNNANNNNKQQQGKGKQQQNNNNNQQAKGTQQQGKGGNQQQNNNQQAKRTQQQGKGGNQQQKNNQQAKNNANNNNKQQQG